MALHNSVLQILEKFLVKYTDRKVATDKESDSLQWVHFQIEEGKSKTIFLIDVKCPIDVAENVVNAYIRNMEKYKGLRDSISDILPGWKAVIETFIVSVFGFLGCQQQQYIIWS